MGQLRNGPAHDNRLAITGAIRKVYSENPGEFDPRKYLGPARQAMAEECKDRMIAFGQAGNADKVKAVTCKDMISYYNK